MNRKKRSFYWYSKLLLYYCSHCHLQPLAYFYSHSVFETWVILIDALKSKLRTRWRCPPVKVTSLTLMASFPFPVLSLLKMVATAYSCFAVCLLQADSSSSKGLHEKPLGSALDVIRELRSECGDSKQMLPIFRCRVESLLPPTLWCAQMFTRSVENISLPNTRLKTSLRILSLVFTSQLESTQQQILLRVFCRNCLFWRRSFYDSNKAFQLATGVVLLRLHACVSWPCTHSCVQIEGLASEN